MHTCTRIHEGAVGEDRTVAKLQVKACVQWGCARACESERAKQTEPEVPARRRGIFSLAFSRTRTEGEDRGGGSG
eukprot:3262407-Pleurochrysis_carterae.AAC.1